LQARGRPGVVEDEPASHPPDTGTRPTTWWKEVLFVAVFYGGYTVVRDIRGSRPVSRVQAFTNADRLIDVERFLGIFQEQRLQQAFLSHRLFIAVWDVFYDTAHFAVTGAVLVWLFYRRPRRYRLWRNILAVTTALALIGFAFFPLMPPRLLPASYHFVDTLRTIGGLWSFDSGEMVRVSNQYAAMPSLHIAWSSWSALAVGPMIKPRWGKVVVYSYPSLTLFTIVVTANHYFLDAAGGALVLGAGYVVARAITRVAPRVNPASPG